MADGHGHGQGHGHEHGWRPVPILPYRDAEVTAAFWTSLGFHVVDATPGDAAYLIAVRDGAELHFVGNPDVDPSAGWFRCYVAVDDVDALHVEWSRLGLGSEGPSSLQPPTDMPWGLREMWLTDPDGTVVRLATSG